MENCLRIDKERCDEEDRFRIFNAGHFLRTFRTKMENTQDERKKDIAFSFKF